jgi:micrococcal nuclease
MYEYAAKLVGVHDGDTITVDVDLGFDLHYVGLALRLYGLNAPELATAAGKVARQFTVDWLASRPALTIRTVKDKREKFGRMLATVIDPATGTSLNRALIDAGQAVPYLVPDGYWTSHP